MTEETKYEAYAFIKIKGEKGEDNRREVEDEKFLTLLGKMLFEEALNDVFKAGIETGYVSPRFMIQLTDFFVSCTSTFYMAKKSQEEIIKDIESFLDAVKADTVETIKEVMKARKGMSYPNTW